MCRRLPIFMQAWLQQLFSSCNRLAKTMRFMWSTPTPNPPESFRELLNHIKELLKTQKPSSKKVISALDTLRTMYPVPHVEIVPKEIWPMDGDEPTIYVQNHVKSTLADAVALLEATGRRLSSKDENLLKLIITRPCAYWSVTYPSHMDDAWMKHFRLRYPHLKGLVPILDSVTYAEELKEFPYGYLPSEPNWFLLATPESYFIHLYYDFYGADYLLRAGDTLEDVYEGLKNWRWAESCDDMWDCEVESSVLSRPCHCFPWYERLENGNFHKWRKEISGEFKKNEEQDLCKECASTLS